MVQLRDGKAYDPEGAATAPRVSSRRASTAAAAAAGGAAGAARAATSARNTRRSTRLAPASESEDLAGSDTPRTQLFAAAGTPGRGKRARPSTLAQQAATPVQQLDSSEEDSDYEDDADLLDQAGGDFDQGLREAADMELPGSDDPSPSQMHASKKARATTPASARKAATKSPAGGKRGGKLQRSGEVGAGTLSLVAASMVLLAAVLLGALLPQAAPHRAALQAHVQRGAAAANEAILQPLQAHTRVGVNLAAAKLSAGRASAEQAFARASATSRQRLAGTQRALAAHTASARQQAAATWAAVTARASGLTLPSAAQLSAALAGIKEQALARAGRAPWSTSVFASILPAGSQWTELAADITDHLRKPAAQRSHKAPAIVLTCGSEAACDKAAATLATLPPGGSGCALNVHASELQAGGEAAATLQATLAPFLRRCPAGLVLLRGVQALPLTALPALHNALSELGGFQYNGAVDGSGAAYALLMQAPADQAAVLAGVTDTDGVQDAIKALFFGHLQQQLQQEIKATSAAAAQSAAAQGVTDAEQLQEQGDAAAEAQWGAVSRALSTLHRRIEFAAPIKVGAA